MPTLRHLAASSSETGKEDIDWIRHQPGETGSNFLSVGKTKGDYIVRYAGIADYHIDLSSETVRWELAALRNDEKQDSAVHLAKNQVLPMMLSTQQLLVLHASSVVLECGYAIAFSGPSAIGKSTIAKAFHDHNSSTILADDWISIQQRETHTILHSYSDEVENGLARQPPDGTSHESEETDRSHQFSISDLSPFKTSSHPLKRIYLLEKGEDDSKIHIEPLRAKSRYVSLARNLFRLDPKNHDQLQKELDLLSSLLTRIPIYTLRYPRRHKQLPELIETLLSIESS